MLLCALLLANKHCSLLSVGAVGLADLLMMLSLYPAPYLVLCSAFAGNRAGVGLSLLGGLLLPSTAEIKYR